MGCKKGWLIFVQTIAIAYNKLNRNNTCLLYASYAEPSKKLKTAWSNDKNILIFQGTITPQIGSSVSGSVGVSLGPFVAELRLTGYVLTTSFPTKIIIEFNKFPLEVR